MGATNAIRILGAQRKFVLPSGHLRSSELRLVLSAKRGQKGACRSSRAIAVKMGTPGDDGALRWSRSNKLNKFIHIEGN